MSISLNQLKNYWSTLALSHQQVRSFGWGPSLDLTSRIETQFPFIHIIPTSSSIGLNVVTHTLTVLCVDLVRMDDFEQLDEVWSDTQQVLTDFKSHFIYSAPEWVSLIGEPTLTPVLEDYRDRYSGWSMVIQLQVDLDMGDCDLPFLNFTSPIC